MDILFKIFTPIFYILYLLVAFIWPSVRTYWQTGINPFVFENKDDAHSYIGKWFKILLTMVFIAIVLFLFLPGWYQFLVPVTYMDKPAMKIAGMALCILSLTWTSIAQSQMGRSWRIGIDQVNPTELKTRGLFSISRNPIFFGMILTLLGFLLLLPNALTLLTFVLGYILIQVQIRLEEEFLGRTHGEKYEAYKKRVRRML